jgi:tetratricopeptide (TPR) repeat protein
VLLTTISRLLGRVDDAKRFEAQSIQPPADRPWPNPFDPDSDAPEVVPVTGKRIVHKPQTQGRQQVLVSAMWEMASSAGDGQDDLWLGVSTGLIGDWVEAEKLFRKAIARNLPDYATGRCCLGIALFFQADPYGKEHGRTAAAKLLEAALVELHNALALKPDLGEAHICAAYCLKLLQRSEEAVRECTLAIQVMPQSADAHFTLGEILNELGKSTEAIPHLENAARLAPANDTRARDLLQQIRDRKP